MQKSLFLLILFVLPSFSYSQNLVQNSSFEELSIEPCGITMTSAEFNSNMISWQCANLGTPDIFLTTIDSVCWNFQPNSIYPGPIGIKGPQLPHSGDAFVGIFAYTIPGLDQRDYIEIALESPMEIGSSYIIEFYVSLADSTEFSVNNVGAYLSSESIYSPTTGVLDYEAQLIFPDFIDDTENWVRIADTIVVEESFSYLSIGNFNDDDATSTQANPGSGTCVGCYGAYYYIDDVSVTEYFPTSVDEASMQFSIQCFPNPFTSQITLQSDRILQDISISIFDASGKIVWEQQSNDTDRLQLDLSELQKGLYFMDLHHKFGTETIRLIRIKK
jgi:hypothetical protein